jgi:anti-sigma factor RsiW
MTPLDPKTREQLCAWMDGELPSDEARFLERRLASDAELRAQWERWQLASACIKGESPLPMRRDLSERVLAAISVPENAGATARRRPVWGWAIAASVAALAVMVGMQMRPEKIPARPDTVARTSETFAPPITASPASADLVDSRFRIAKSAIATTEVVSPETVTPETAGHAAAEIRPSASGHTTEIASLQSPMPLSTQSPTEFPLMATSEAKAWPRSPLSASGNDASMEAYLVRHNEMVSGGGLGGFVPYVDVVTRERDGASDNGADNARAIEDGGQ